MSEAIDDAILSCVESRWLKVARIVGDVSKKLGWFDQAHPRCDEIAERMKAMVEDGRLELQGDLDRWRNSEVRLPAR